MKIAKLACGTAIERSGARLNSQPDEKQQEVVDLAVSERRTLQKARKKHEQQLTETRIQHKIQEAERLEEKAERLAQEIAALQQEVLITSESDSLPVSSACKAQRWYESQSRRLNNEGEN